MATVNMHQAKTHLSRLVEQAIEGEEIIVAKNGKPLVKLVPVQGDSSPRRPGSMKGLIHMAADFDDPLPEDILAHFQGRA